MTSRMRCTAIAVLLVGLTGCRFFGAKVKPDPIPLPAPPRPVEVKAPEPKVEPPGPPPKIETKAPEVPPAVAVIPNPPAPKPKRRPLRKPVTAPGIAPAPPQALKEPPPAGGVETVVPPPPAASIPKLGEILSDDQKIQLLRTCDESLVRAREALGQLRGLNLSPDQKQSMNRVNVFISQAEQARQRDPQTAKQLAERADLLSRDLVRTVR